MNDDPSQEPPAEVDSDHRQAPSEATDLAPAYIESAPVELPAEAPNEESGAGAPVAAAAPIAVHQHVSGRPAITFQGNSYDLFSLGSLITGALILFSCLTCNMGYYCMPVVPVALGIVGILASHQAIDGRRTQLWSWLGIGAGALVLLLILAAVVLYVGFIVLMIAIGDLK